MNDEHEQIDLHESEWKRDGKHRPLFPDHGDRKFYRDKYGQDPTPSDFWQAIIPLVGIAIGIAWMNWPT